MRVEAVEDLRDTIQLIREEIKKQNKIIDRIGRL